MLVRTRYIDQMMERAIRDGATQLVILGAGFDTRAHRFSALLKDVAVIELDYGTTQEYKKRRVEAALGGAPANVVYAPIDSRSKTWVRRCAVPVSSADAGPITFARG